MDDIRARPTNPSHKPGAYRNRGHVSDVADSGHVDASDDLLVRSPGVAGHCVLHFDAIAQRLTENFHVSFYSPHMGWIELSQLKYPHAPVTHSKIVRFSRTQSERRSTPSLQGTCGVHPSSSALRRISLM